MAKTLQMWSITTWTPVPQNYVTNLHVLDVCEVWVGDEGKKYICGMTVTVCKQIVCIEAPLFDELQKHVEGAPHAS